MKKNVFKRLTSWGLNVVMVTSLFAIFEPHITQTVSAESQAEAIVRIARNEVGNKERSADSDNIKYNDWYYGKTVTNSYSGQYAWCAAFVSWCANQAGISTSIIPKDAGCLSMKNTMVDKLNGQPHLWSSGYRPVCGDIIFFGNDSNLKHVGIVTYTDGNTVHYIDGNNTQTTPHGVHDSSRTFSRTDVWGTVTPNYSNVPPIPSDPPTWAKVSLWKSYYMVGEDVNFEMTSDTGNVFTLGIDDENGNRLYTYDTGFDNPSTTKNYIKTFDKAGKYSCWITTYNAAGNIDSERFYFTIYDEKPSVANVNLHKNSYMVGEDVTFEMSSDSGFVFTLGIDDENGNRIHTYDTGFENVSNQKEYTCSFNTPGRYSCWITTYNAEGSIDSERVYFVVYDKAPEYANVDLCKNNFMIGEKIPFELSSDTGGVFTLGIDDKDGNRLHTYDTGFEHPSTHQTYQYTINEPGEYSCWLTTYNAIGHLDSERVYFTVYDKAPTEASVTLWKTFFMVGEEISFDMSSDLGFVFTLGIDDRDGNRLHTYDTGFEHPSTHQTYQYAINEPGEYSCWLTTYNAIGNLDSKRFYFTVYDKAPSQASVKLEKDTFEVGENVNFNMSSDLGFIFTLGIDDADGNRLITYDTGFEIPSNNQTYSQSFEKPGDYICWLTTYNAVGHLDSKKVSFKILSSVTGDCNNDGKLSIVDAVILQKWLLDVPNTELDNWKAADLYKDGKLNVFDFIKLRRMLLTH